MQEHYVGSGDLETDGRWIDLFEGLIEIESECFEMNWGRTEGNVEEVVIIRERAYSVGEEKEAKMLLIVVDFLC